jgi:lipopolysaccharide export system protein LptC
MKFVLPVTAVALVVLVAVWSQWDSIDEGFKITFASIHLDKGRELRMVKARISSARKGRRPYLLTADEAIQDGPDADTIRLRNPKGDITMKSGAWVALTAPLGYYHQKKQNLDLSGGVNMFHDSGLQFTSPTAHIDLAEGTAHSNDPVKGHGPSSDIKAEGFRLLDGGTRVVFTGASRLLLFPTAKGAGAKSGAGPQVKGAQK